MTKLNIFLILCLNLNTTNSWQGILINGQVSGTQLYIPTDPPISIQNVNFNLPYVSNSVGVMLNGIAYFIGGTNGSQSFNSVIIFNPNTNTTTTGSPLNI